MKNTLSDLGNYMFEAIERLNDDSLTDEGLEKEIRRSEAVVKVGTQIINVANTLLKAAQYASEYHDPEYLPALIGMKGGDK